MELYPYYVGYIVILLASSMIGILLLIRIWGLRSVPGAIGLMLAVGSATEWSLTYAMEIYSTTMPEKILWAKLEYFGIVYVALGMFIFTMHYSGRGSLLTARRITLLGTVSTIFFIFALTNEWHHQIWVTVQFTNNLPFGPLNLHHGTVFFFLVAFLYILIALTTLAFFQVATRTQSLYQSQSRIMLTGMLFPWAANFIYITGLNPFPFLDLTPIALSLSNIFLSISFLRYRFMDLRPVAHDSVFNAMKDGVVVLDQKERIADINPVGTFIFQDTGNLLGHDIKSLLPKWSEWHEANPLGEFNHEISVELAGDSLTFSLRTTSVFDQGGKRNGRVLLISDITEQNLGIQPLEESASGKPWSRPALAIRRDYRLR